MLLCPQSHVNYLCQLNVRLETSNKPCTVHMLSCCSQYFVFYLLLFLPMNCHVLQRDFHPRKPSQTSYIKY